MSERSERPNSSHIAFPYYFDGIWNEVETETFPLGFPINFSTAEYVYTPNKGICFGTIYTERDTHISATHFAFPYFFGGVSGVDGDGTGICFGPEYFILASGIFDYDLIIFYGDISRYDNIIQARASRWDVQDYSIIVSTWIKKDDLLRLRNNIRPGAIKQLNRVVYAPKFYDSTFSGKNTLRFLPAPTATHMPFSTLNKMRQDTIGYVQTITEHPIENSDWIDVKIEAKVSSNQML